MSSSQSRGCLGKVSWGWTPPGSKKAGQGIPHCAARQWAGAARAGGHKLPPASTYLAKDRLILQKQQPWAANLYPPGQMPAGRRTRDPILGPRQAGRAGGAPGRTRWGGSCSARWWRYPSWCAQLSRSQTPSPPLSTLPAAGCPGHAGRGVTGRGQPYPRVTPAPRCHPHVPPCCHSHCSATTSCITLWHPNLTQTPHPLGPSSWQLT